MNSLPRRLSAASEMPGTIDTYYWDACLFLAWLKDEKRRQGEMEGIREQVERVRRNEIRVITSALTYSEVTAAKIPNETADAFANVMQRKNIRLIDVSVPIARKAGELKDFYAAKGGKRLGTPDAIHLATAIIYQAKEFHTFDQNNSGGTLGLIPLSGDVAGHNLTICKPFVGAQTSLDLK